MSEALVITVEDAKGNPTIYKYKSIAEFMQAMLSQKVGRNIENKVTYLSLECEPEGVTLADFMDICKTKLLGGDVYYVPFAYERYGRLPVPAKSPKEALERAEHYLENIETSVLNHYSQFLEDSEEIDREGVLLDAKRNPVEGDV